MRRNSYSASKACFGLSSSGSISASRSSAGLAAGSARRAPGRTGRPGRWRDLLVFQLHQIAPRGVDHRRRHAGQLRHLQAIALAGRAFLHACRNTMWSRVHRVEMHVGDLPEFLRQLGQLEIMGGEQGVGAGLLDQLAGDRPGQGRPSKVEVPRPISSISTRLCSVALCRMLAVSVISTMKVERPPARSSEAPMRVKIWSTGPIRALSPARSCRSGRAARSARSGACRSICRPCWGR